ncbi:hypothetical protein TNCV_1525591 [Trichonephila clavipes]|nr:hypothetical protein TNCV_1525591 [Trichonephila clavipes]
MFDSSSFVNPTPLAHADTSRDVVPRGGTSQEVSSVTWLLTNPAYSAAMPGWMATTCSNALVSMNTRPTDLLAALASNAQYRCLVS